SAFESFPHPRIPLPRDLYRSYGLDRDNSMGINLANDDQQRALAAQIADANTPQWRATPLVPGAASSAAAIDVTNPADRRQVVGHWQPADTSSLQNALDNPVAVQPAWDALPAASRAV